MHGRGIAEAYYGVPMHLKKQALAKLDESLAAIIEEFYAMTGKGNKDK